MRLLFVKKGLAWPRSSGQDVHCYHQMRALAGLGHSIALATLREPSEQALDGLPLEARYCFQQEGLVPPGANGLALSRLQERFRSYWGIDTQHIHAVGAAARDFRADAVVVVGLEALPYLGAVDGPVRVWYAADEWLWHHLSQMYLTRPNTWGNLRTGLIKGLYERVYASRVDRVWVVTPEDRSAMRWVTGIRDVDVLPNGVDGTFYAPQEQPTAEHTCVFWGRLDFGPNIQALQWFCGRVWPALRAQQPEARLTIIGFQPSAEVVALGRQAGVQVVGELPDLRAEVGRNSVVVLPFVSGGGIKNKLLEAAGMGKAIVCSPRARSGLQGDPPVVTASRPAEWTTAVLGLWTDPDKRRQLGGQARRWVLEHHTWEAAATRAAAGLAATRAEKEKA